MARTHPNTLIKNQVSDLSFTKLKFMDTFIKSFYTLKNKIKLFEKKNASSYY